MRIDFVFCLFLMGFILTACGGENETDYRLADHEFTNALLDIELAREAAQSAPFNMRDSLTDLYMEAVALRYELTTEELLDEVKLRMKTEEDFEEIYDEIRARLDSIDASDENK